MLRARGHEDLDPLYRVEGVEVGTHVVVRLNTIGIVLINVSQLHINIARGNGGHVES